MADKVRIGFIGAGGIARSHMRRLLEIDEAEVVALAEPSEEALARIREQFPEAADIPAYSGHEEMLRRVELDAVQIHTPHTQHYQQARDALAAGLHVLLEKPMVCSARDAHRLIEAAQGKVLMISYQRHFQGPYMYMHDQVHSGALGRVQYVAALLSQGWLRGTRGTWRQQKALSGGGQLNDSGSHIIDMLLWTTGLRAEEVHAFVEPHGTEVDIDSTVNVRFANGALGTLSIIGDSPMWWEEFSIWGSEGALLFRNGTLLRRTHDDPAMEEVTDLPDDSSPDQNWVDAILGRAAVGVPPECGLRVIELTEAAWRSADEGRPVRVAELA